MNLAEAAPKVEKAKADPAPRVDGVKVAAAAHAEPVRVSAAPRVDPAVPVDDPRAYAPPSVINAVTLSMQQSQQSLGLEQLRAAAAATTPGGHLEFESYAAVIQGGPQKNIVRRLLPCIFEERDFMAYGEIKYFVAVSGQTCFVYAEETSLQPYFAIDLSQYIPILEDSDKPDPTSFTISPEPETNKPRPTMITILLKTKKSHKQAYQFTFETVNDRSLAKRFLDICVRASASECDKRMQAVQGFVVDGNGKGKITTK